MKVYAKIKIHEHPLEPDGQGVHRGDIVGFWPIVDDIGKKTLNHFLLVVVDLNVPCGSSYTVKDGHKQWSCGSCKQAEQCDIHAYKQPILDTTGEKPVLVKNRRYRIDRTQFISQETEQIIVKTEKSEQEKQLLVSQALANEQLKAIIEEKI